MCCFGVVKTEGKEEIKGDQEKMPTNSAVTKLTNEFRQMVAGCLANTDVLAKTQAAIHMLEAAKAEREIEEATPDLSLDDALRALALVCLEDPQHTEQCKEAAIKMLPAVEEQLREGSRNRNRSPPPERPHRRAAVEAVRQVARLAAGEEDGARVVAADPQDNGQPHQLERGSRHPSSDTMSSEDNRSLDEAKEAEAELDIKKPAIFMSPHLWKKANVSSFELTRILRNEMLKNVQPGTWTQEIGEMVLDLCSRWHDDPSAPEIPIRLLDMLFQISLWGTPGATKELVQRAMRKVSSGAASAIQRSEKVLRDESGKIATGQTAGKHKRERSSHTATIPTERRRHVGAIPSVEEDAPTVATRNNHSTQAASTNTRAATLTHEEKNGIVGRGAVRVLTSRGYSGQKAKRQRRLAQYIMEFKEKKFTSPSQIV